MSRRDCNAADRLRLPELGDLGPWTASPWFVGRPSRDEGHFDDWCATLTRADGKARAVVFITSYDFDGRSDGSLHEWVRKKVRDEIATAQRKAAA